MYTYRLATPSLPTALSHPALSVLHWSSADVGGNWMGDIFVEDLSHL